MHLAKKIYNLIVSTIFCAEASCASQIKTARAVREEFGEPAAVRSGVADWAKVSYDHSERGVDKVVRKQGTKLNVTMSNVRLDGEEIPYIDPRDFFRYIVDNGLTAMLAGLPIEQQHLAPQVWRDFWRKYKILHPHHQIFDVENIGDYGRLIGLYIHGDEGRTLKKSGLMVTSVQSVLGRGFDNKRLKRDVSGFLKPQVNFAGQTFTSRFVSFVMPKTLYDKKPNIYHQALDLYSRNLSGLLEDGVYDSYTGDLYKFVVLGCKGDLPYLAKSGYLNRTFNTGAKKGNSTKSHGICHLCLAGYPDYPAEQINTWQPTWTATMGVTLPWSTTPPFIMHLLHDAIDPARFFAVDLWHCVHLGFGRSWVASVVCLVLDVLPQTNLDLKWKFLTDHYITWCRANKKQTHVSKVTAYLMSYDDKTGKQGRWHKGALTTNFCGWLLRLLQDVPADSAGFLARCQSGTANLNAMFECFYQGGFFLDRTECEYSALCGMKFWTAYSFLARKQFEKDRPDMFPLYPKLHLMHHMILRIREDGNEFGFSQNAMATSCQMDEDVIGRVSRISRRVSIRMVMERTMGRYLVGCHTAWKSAGLITWVGGKMWEKCRCIRWEWMPIEPKVYTQTRSFHCI